jgi:hypothetical protein
VPSALDAAKQKHDQHDDDDEDDGSDTDVHADAHTHVGRTLTTTSHRGPGGRTRDQLYNEAREKNIPGRSKMSKAQLEQAVGR